VKIWKRVPWVHIGVFLGYVLLTMAMTWPLITKMSTHMAGEDIDVWLNQWATWWTGKALKNGLNFYHTNYILYPQGASLVFFSFSHLNSAISLLVAPLIGDLAAYNVAVLLAFALSGFNMYLLVKHLTGTRAAAFVAGLVFAFNPYHMSETIHLHLVSTQWMPLFMLSLTKMIRRKDEKGYRHVWLAALWFVLTALSGWHLMTMLACLTALYLLHQVVFERSDWSPKALSRLVLLAIMVAVALAPLLWPIVYEQLTTKTPHMMAEDANTGFGNDLISFLLPAKRNPVLGPLFSDFRPQSRMVEKFPSYLGYVPLILATAGVATAFRDARFWLLAGATFLFLSLGSQITFRGTPLHTLHLPWATYISQLLRQPLRLSVLLFFSLSVLIGFGVRWLYLQAASRRKMLAPPVLALLTALVLVEYLFLPFPVALPWQSPFIDRLALEEGDFAVVDLPMGRQQAKYHMFLQTIHNHKIVGGHLSRPPDDKYAFVDANPLLGPLRAGLSPDPDTDIEGELAALDAQGIRYIIVHKPLIPPHELEAWRERLARLLPTFYEDEWLIAYRVASGPPGEASSEEIQRLDAKLGDHIHLRSYQLNASSVRAGNVLKVTLQWESDGPISDNYHVFVHLLDSQGSLVAQHDGPPANGAHPTWTWQGGETIQDEHTLVLDRDLPAGRYSLSVGMYDILTKERLSACGPDGERLPADRIVLQETWVTSP
jgi:hypothetical protein